MRSTQFTLGEEQPPSDGVVEAVATTMGVSATEVTPPLYEAIDPDALDRLFRSTGNGERGSFLMAFEYGDYEVTIRGDQSIVVEVTDSARSGSSRRADDV